jgi:hypothetical protein
MSSFADRTNYFQSICNKNKLIADGRAVSDDDPNLRKSFFRINDEQEFDAGCVNWSHFPCVVHLNYRGRYKQEGIALPMRTVYNTLVFLAKADKDANQLSPDGIAAAYDLAFTAMEQFIAYLVNDHLDNAPTCNALFNFNLSNSTFEEAGPFSGNLYGWQLTFWDEERACQAGYDESEWFDS